MKHETQKNVLIIAEDEISTFTKDLYKIVSSCIFRQVRTICTDYLNQSHGG